MNDRIVLISCPKCEGKDDSCSKCDGRREIDAGYERQVARVNFFLLLFWSVAVTVLLFASAFLLLEELPWWAVLALALSWYWPLAKLDTLREAERDYRVALGRRQAEKPKNVMSLEDLTHDGEFDFPEWLEEPGAHHKK